MDSFVRLRSQINGSTKLPLLFKSTILFEHVLAILLKIGCKTFKVQTMKYWLIIPFFSSCILIFFSKFNTWILCHKPKETLSLIYNGRVYLTSTLLSHHQLSNAYTSLSKYFTSLSSNAIHSVFCLKIKYKRFHFPQLAIKDEQSNPFFS